MIPPTDLTDWHGYAEYHLLLAMLEISKLSKLKWKYGNNNLNNIIQQLVARKTTHCALKRIYPWAAGVRSYLTFVRTIISSPAEMLLMLFLITYTPLNYWFRLFGFLHKRTSSASQNLRRVRRALHFDHREISSLDRSEGHRKIVVVSSSMLR